MKPVAVLDANVLFSAALRDTFVQCAIEGAFQARWTTQIHEEWTRNVLKQRPDTREADLQRTRRLMDLHVPNSLVEGFEHLIQTIVLPDPDDRHVLAAAIHSGAGFIVTWNLRDFPAQTLALHSIQAISPDVFAVELLKENPVEVVNALSKQRARLKNPPIASVAFLETLLRQGMTRFVGALEPLEDQL